MPVSEDHVGIRSTGQGRVTTNAWIQQRLFVSFAENGRRWSRVHSTRLTDTSSFFFFFLRASVESLFLKGKTRQPTALFNTKSLNVMLNATTFQEIMARSNDPMTRMKEISNNYQYRTSYR